MSKVNKRIRAGNTTTVELLKNGGPKIYKT